MDGNAPAPAKRSEATQAQIVAAAFDVFSRYGFSRTSMSDIAAAADVSRTSLYNHFKTKEQVFQALSKRINAEVTTAVGAAATAPGPIEARLGAIIDAWVSWAFDLLRKSPHGRELIDEKNRLCAATSADANAAFEALVTRVLAATMPRARVSSSARLAPQQAAQLLISAVKGVVHGEDDAERMRSKVRQLVAIFVAGLRSR
jgi:AcrR family transcriptional regulator